jgi:molybdopterin molybdotransferase
MTLPSSAPVSLAEAISCVSGYDPRALPVARVNEIIDRVVAPVQAVERVSVRAALGRILGEDVVSPIDVPSHDNSAMDGYALRASDLLANGATRLRVAGTALAGQPFTGRCEPGEAVRIMTGAVMPDGLDTVVIQEGVSVEADQVVVPPVQQA